MQSTASAAARWPGMSSVKSMQSITPVAAARARTARASRASYSEPSTISVRVPGSGEAAKQFR